MLPCPRRAEGSPAWSKPEDDKWRDDKTCSYCGSLHPDDFMRLAEEGKPITPTDKNYKAYIDKSTKFYFQHLSEDQKKKFIELLNSKKLTLEYPGHFYNLPFFISGPRGF